MPINPTLLERILLRFVDLPVPLLDGFLYWMAGKAVLVASKMGVFDALSKGSKSAQELAKEIKASEKGIGMLLRVLEALGYVKKSGERYANTKISSKWLVRNSPYSVVVSLPLFDGLWKRVSDLEEIIRKGKPSVAFWEWMDQHPGAWRDHQLHWRGLARMIGLDIVSKVKLPPEDKRLLDLGGGHGLYAIQFCRKESPAFCGHL